jgi:hypothetical protein
VLKITNKEYFLPVVEALEGYQQFTSGTTLPMLIRGVCTRTGDKSDYVVKYVNSPRMSIKASISELVAAFIARELELNVVEPAIINITDVFVETLRGKDGFRHASNSLGLNYGSKFVVGYMEFVQNQKLNESQLIAAEQIFAFDIFISNPDRGPQGKQNLLTDGENVIIFDHELAFSFIYDLFYKNPTPWIITENDKNLIKKHYFYTNLRENEHNFDSFVEGFTVLDENFWKIVSGLIPNTWDQSHMIEIKNNLNSLVEHRMTFLEELYKVLS